MSARIRIELRDAERIFSERAVTKAEFIHILQSMLPDDDDFVLGEPFYDGDAQVLVFEAVDPRRRWTSRRHAGEDRAYDLE